MLKNLSVKGVLCLMLALMMLMPMAACQSPADDEVVALEPTADTETEMTATEAVTEPEETEVIPEATEAEATEEPTETATEAPKTEAPKTEEPKSETQYGIELPEYPTTLKIIDSRGNYQGSVRVTKLTVDTTRQSPRLYVNCENPNNRTISSLYLRFRCYDEDGILLDTKIIGFDIMAVGETGEGYFVIPNGTVRIEYALDESHIYFY